jgi:hypothetical protein
MSLKEMVRFAAVPEAGSGCNGNFFKSPCRYYYRRDLLDKEALCFEKVVL